MARSRGFPRNNARVCIGVLLVLGLLAIPSGAVAEPAIVDRADSGCTIPLFDDSGNFVELTDGTRHVVYSANNDKENLTIICRTQLDDPPNTRTIVMKGTFCLNLEGRLVQTKSGQVTKTCHYKT